MLLDGCVVCCVHRSYSGTDMGFSLILAMADNSVKVAGDTAAHRTNVQPTQASKGKMSYLSYKSSNSARTPKS